MAEWLRRRTCTQQNWVQFPLVYYRYTYTRYWWRQEGHQAEIAYVASKSPIGTYEPSTRQSTTVNSDGRSCSNRKQKGIRHVKSLFRRPTSYLARPGVGLISGKSKSDFFYSHFAVSKITPQIPEATPDGYTKAERVVAVFHQCT